MLSNRQKQSRPLFHCLMICSFLGSIVAFIIGSWLLITSHFMFSTSVAASAIQKFVKFDSINQNQISAVNYSYLVLLIIGIFTLIIGFLLLWNAIDIFVLMTKSGEKMSCLQPYRKYLEREMVTGAERNGKTTV